MNDIAIFCLCSICYNTLLQTLLSLYNIKNLLLFDVIYKAQLHLYEQFIEATILPVLRWCEYGTPARCTVKIPTGNTGTTDFRFADCWNMTHERQQIVVVSIATSVIRNINGYNDCTLKSFFFFKNLYRSTMTFQQLIQEIPHDSSSKIH